MGIIDATEKFKFVRLLHQDGILQISIHLNGGPAVWDAAPGGVADELCETLYLPGRDPDVRVVILTGTGNKFVTNVAAMDKLPDTAFWTRVFQKEREMMHNLLNLEAPVIGAVNGPAFVHAELVAMSDIVLAAETAVFADKAHVLGNVVPGDGVHVWWPMVLGPNRGRHFLLTGAEIPAAEAKELGFVAEVMAPDKLLERAWEIARDLAARPPQMLRYTRVALTQHIKRRMLDDLGYGLILEGMGLMSLLGK
jgi:enoyl-CoA hydratase/carnithine racemase